eukprot:535188_1
MDIHHQTNKYLYTNKIKTIVAYSLESEGFPNPATGIRQGSKILLDHIISILLYTDWTVLCNKFSATFRGKSEYESLESIKNRNREYANWARILWETIEVFGNWGYSPEIYDKASEEEKKNMEFEEGP